MRRAAASTAGGGSISGLPSVKSKTLSAPRSALRRAPSSNMRRIHDAFVRLLVTARETITAAATILWRPREGACHEARPGDLPPTRRATHHPRVGHDHPLWRLDTASRGAGGNARGLADARQHGRAQRS